VLTQYFVAKARDFKALNADLIRHRELIRDGEPPVFLRDDHPKILYIVKMKFRAAKATYRKQRDEENADKDSNIQLIKHHMKECMNQFYKVLPQLDMLAAHHNLTLGEENASVGGDDLSSLRSGPRRKGRGEEPGSTTSLETRSEIIESISTRKLQLRLRGCRDGMIIRRGH
jgi:hypothetical protein